VVSPKLVDTLDREVRSQIAELSKDLEQLMARVGDVANKAPAKKSV
jgi:hypothetical protein